MSRRLAVASSPCIEVMATPIEGCRVLKFTPFADKRGTFAEAYNYATFANLGLPSDWEQDNISYSKEKVLRGLHFQTTNPQGKLVRCIQGGILDVCVDLRPESPSYMETYCEILSEEKAMYLPPGTAHGFAVLSKEAYVYYKCTTIYDKESDSGILWSDPDLGIDWPWKDPVVSLKDQSFPKLADYLNSLK